MSNPIKQAKEKNRLQAAATAKRHKRIETILDMLPDPIDAKFMPAVIPFKTKHHDGMLTFDDLLDTEVSILMSQYRPLPLVNEREWGSPSFFPVEQEDWDEYWFDNTFTYGNGIDVYRNPVSPFTFHVKWHESIRQKELMVQWYSRLSDETLVTCRAKLNVNQDATEWITRNLTDKNGRVYRTEIVDADPFLSGTYDKIKWATIAKRSFHYTYYWAWPSEYDREWGHVIDSTTRNKFREIAHE